jgi:subtilase-type serine protease
VSHFPPTPMRRKSLLLMSLSLLALAGCGGGEDDGTGGNWFTISPIAGGSGTLGSFYMSSITSQWREAAASFRNNNPRYRTQNGTFNIGGSPVFANPLHSSRVDYAHALGLTGAGQVIAIVDDGFRASHETIAGRVIATTGNPILEDHGAMVASVAAGSSGSMVGVAPGAGLVLSDWGNVNFDNLRLAAIEARSRGAVAQNNSWGYNNSPIGTVSFNNIFGNPTGAAWLSELRNYALGTAGWSGGVVVFAIDNVNTGSAGLMDALPSLSGQSDLQRAWLAVGNAIPIFDDNGVSGVARLESSPCYQSGPWCLMADGSWVGASAASNNSYQSLTGSSFAAPQVSGALALLAEAFPNLTPHQLRLRLLASADNTFTGFTTTGTIDLDDGTGVFNHNWSSIYGHGFLDIRAALLPIGQTGVSLNGDEVVPTKDYAFSTGGAMGDAVTRSLEGIDVTISDQLGGDFSVAAKNFASQAVVSDLGETLAAQTFAKDYRQTRTTPLSPLADTFAAHSGQSMDLVGPDGARASVLVGGAENYGLALSQRLGEGEVALDVGVKLARDGGSLMGFSGTGSSGGASMASVTLALSTDTGDAGGFFALSGEMGVADLGTTTAITSAGQAQFNSLRLDVGGRGVLASGDRLTVGIAMPIAVTSGGAEMLVPVRTAGGSEVRSVGIDLAPQERQIDMSISYAVPMSDKSEFLMEVLHAENYGNITGSSDTAAVFGMKWSF